MKRLRKHWPVLVSAALAAVAALPSCSKDQRSASSAGGQQLAGDTTLPGAGSITTGGLSESQSLLLQAQARCPDSVNCPEGVGVLALASDSGVSLCTAFLVAPDLVATSARCVPPRIRSGELSCKDRLRIVFPSVGNVAMSQAGCAQVADATQAGQRDEDERSQNYAFIRLDHPVSRAWLPIDDRGLGDGDELQVAEAESISDTVPFGEIRIHRCKAIQKSLAFPEFRDAADPVGLLGDCPMVRTGWGAPAIDRNGNVRAIVHAIVADRDLLQQGYQNLLQDQVSDMAFATNLACVHTPLESAPRSLPDACGSMVLSGSPAALLPSTHIVSTEDSQSSQRDLDSLFGAWSSGSSDRFKWKESVQSDATSRTVTPVPDCINQPDRWLDQYHHWYLVFVGGYEADASVDLQLPSWTARFELSSYLQVYHSVETLPAVHATLSFKPRDIHGSGRSVVVLKAQGQGGAPDRVVFQGTLQKCQ